MKNILFLGVVAVVLATGITFWKHRSSTQPNRNETISEVSESNSWHEQVIAEIGLSFRMPPTMTFRKEVADNEGVMRSLGFYVESSDPTFPYMLYALYMNDKEVTSDNLEQTKIGMDPASIKEANISGYKGTEGLILGEKTRYITSVIKDGRIFSVSTIPPTTEGKALTNKLLTTFKFQ